MTHLVRRKGNSRSQHRLCHSGSNALNYEWVNCTRCPRVPYRILLRPHSSELKQNIAKHYCNVVCRSPLIAYLKVLESASVVSMCQGDTLKTWKLPQRQLHKHHFSKSHPGSPWKKMESNRLKTRIFRIGVSCTRRMRNWVPCRDRFLSKLLEDRRKIL